MAKRLKSPDDSPKRKRGRPRVTDCVFYRKAEEIRARLSIENHKPANSAAPVATLEQASPLPEVPSFLGHKWQEPIELIDEIDDGEKFDFSIVGTYCDKIRDIDVFRMRRALRVMAYVWTQPGATAATMAAELDVFTEGNGHKEIRSILEGLAMAGLIRPDQCY